MSSQKDTSLKVPILRFREFQCEWNFESINNLSSEPLSNGVFNDPKKVGSGIKIINVKDMYEGYFINTDNLTLLELDKKDFEKNKVLYGDIFFTRSSLVKEGIAYPNIYLGTSNEVTYDGHLIRLRLDNLKILSNFAIYNLRTGSSRVQFVSKGKTTTMTTIGQDEIGSIKISFPCLPEQQKITSFLWVIDEKIEKLKTKKSLLEKYKKGVMQKIFSREMRFLDENGKEYGEWEEKRLGEIADIYQPKTIGGSDLTNEGYDVYGANGIIGKYHSFNHQTEQVVVTCRGNTCGTINYTKPESYITGNAMVVNLDGRIDNKKFIYYYLCNDDIRYLITGSGQPQITGTIKKHKIIIPKNKYEQQKIASFLSELDKKIDAANSEIESAEKWKKGLLQGMFV